MNFLLSVNDIIYICLGIGAVVLIFVVIIVLYFKNKKSAQKEALQKKENTLNNMYDNIFTILGGKENVEKITCNRSRLTFVVKDMSLVKKDEFEKIEIKDVIFMSDRIICSFGEMALEFYNNLNNLLK